MRVAYPPSAPEFIPGEKSVFLAGSIEMGASIDWQSRVIEALSDKEVLVLNPRRPEWDSSWEQTIANPVFVGQVNWELDELEHVDVIVMYFDPLTKSPISLLELGMFASSGKMVVCCPDGFWRKGNVDIVCERNNIPVLPTFRELLNYLTASL